MTDKKKKPKRFMNERKPAKRKTVAKPKPVEKLKTVKERIIEEHKRGVETPLIAKLLNVRVNFVSKVLYLHRQSEATIIRPVVSKPKAVGILKNDRHPLTEVSVPGDTHRWNKTNEKIPDGSAELAVDKLKEEPIVSKPEIVKAAIKEGWMLGDDPKEKAEDDVVELRTFEEGDDPT